MPFKLPDMPFMTAPLVYLAGDLVFRPDALGLFARLKAICARHGLEGCAPFDGQDAVRGLAPSRETTMKIIEADRDLMDRCVAGLFCIDPFRRAADMDPGTAVEIGYMHAQRKPLEGYTVDPRPYGAKVESYWREAWGFELRPRENAGDIGSGSLEDPDGILVHSDGMAQNGMVDGFITLSGGRISGAPTLEEAFEKAAMALAARL
jgi:nucleoside 2-deoxyribosyltransferase